MKPNYFKHSCRCLHNVHFWKESTEVGDIKWPLSYCVQWKFLAKHIFSFHFIVQHICPWGESHSWLQKHCNELPKKCCMRLTALCWEKFGAFKCGSDRNEQKLIFLWCRKFAFSRKCIPFSSGRAEDFYISLEFKTSSCTLRPNRTGNFQPGGK